MAGDSQRKFFIQDTFILFAVGAVAATARICIRYFMTRRLGIEEIIMFVSLLCWTGDTILIVVTVDKGTNQVFGGDAARLALSQEEVDRRTVGSKAFISAWYLYISAIWGCKFAILLFYKRLMDRVAQKKAIQVSGVILMITYLFCLLGVTLVCRPYYGLWQIYPNPGPACTDGYHFVWLVGITNILTDLMLLAVPMPLLFHLQINLVKKILLGCMFSLGIFVVIATILRIYFTIVGGEISNMTFWSMIETSTLFIVSNAPGIRAIFTWQKQEGRSGASQSYEMRGPAGVSTIKHAANITTMVHDGGDSQERIIDEEGGPMVIHQNIAYDVVVEQSSGPISDIEKPGRV